jgi:DNA repair exonuclease SbcCD ATPase subunit
MLIAKFKEFEGQFSADPQAMREWTERIKAMSDEVALRNPFKAIFEARQELEKAVRKQNSLKGRISEIQEEIDGLQELIDLDEKTNSSNETTIKNKNELAKKQQELKDTTDALGEAIVEESEAREKEKQSWNESRRQVDKLASAISALGDEIAGEAGRILNLIGSVMTFATTTADGMKKVAATGAESISTIEKASVILTIISAAISLAKQISELIPDDHGQYEKFADKQKEIRKMTDAVHEYELAVLEARNAEQNWFASSKLNSLSNQWLVSSKASESYFKKLNELQATYQNESGSGWLTKLGAQANKTIASISGAVNKAFGIDGTFVGDLQTKLAQTVWASTIGGPVGVGMTAENDIWKKGWDKNYVEGLTAAWKNLRIETRAASKGFLGTGIGGKSQKTEDLREYVKKNLGLDLFDEKTGWLNEETYDIVMKKYGDKLVGETKETLEALKELKDKHDEFIDQLHDYVNEMYAPIMTNFTDAMWAWYDEGKDALGSFREAAGDTFRNIVSDLLNTQMLKLFGNEMSETISKLYEDYFDKGTISESQLMSGVTAAVDKASMQFQQAQPVLQQTMTMVEQALNSYGISMKESAEYFDDLSSSFSDMLLDMTDDLDDFAKSVKKKMYEAMLDVFVYNSPFETIVNGEKKTFDSFYAYLEDWKTRTQKIIEGTDKTWAEQLSAEEAASRIAQLKTSIANLDKLIAGSTDEAEIARLKETIAELQGLIGQIEQGQNVDFAAREQERLEEQNDELRESYNILKNISKTYAELSGWGLEAQIDASPLANLADDILSVINDSSKSIEDWKNDIVKMMTDDLVKELVLTDEFKNRVRELQEMYVAVMSGEKKALEGFTELAQFIGEDGAIDTKAALKYIADLIAGLATTAKETADNITDSFGTIGEDGKLFENLHDSFLDALMDIESDADEFRKKLNQTLVRDLIERSVLDVPVKVSIAGGEVPYDNFDAYIDDWNRRYMKVVNDESLVQEQKEFIIDSMIDELVREEERLMELSDTLRERLRKVEELKPDSTFREMADGWVSTLMDMESTAEDWSDSIGRTMAQRIIEKTLVSTTIQPLLDRLQDAFNEAVESGKDAGGVIDWHRVLGDESLTSALESIKDAYPELQETVDNILGKLGITKEAEAAKTALDDLTDTIISGLTDAGMTAEKFGRDIAKTLTTQMMKSVLEGKYSTTIRKIQEEWATALESSDTDAIESLKERIVKLYQVMGKDTRELREIFKEIEESAEDVDTTFKDMSDSWSSSLTDMDSDAADWGRQIGKTLVSRLVSELVVGKHLQQYLDDIQSAYDRALEKYGNDEDGMARIVSEVTPAINAAVEATRQWEPAVEAVSKAFEKLEYSSTPFDGLKDSFVSSLMDMESSAADIGDDIGRTLAEAMLREFVLGDAFDRQLDEWKERYRDIMGTEGVDEEDRARQLNQLKSDIAAAREGYVAEAMRIQDILGTSVYPDQNATVNMADKATYDQFETYLGIATSQQICSEQQLGVQQQILSTLQTLSGITGGSDSPQMRELCGLMSLNNDYLLTIRETGKGIKSLLDQRLATIDAKLGNLQKL